MNHQKAVGFAHRKAMVRAGVQQRLLSQRQHDSQLFPILLGEWFDSVGNRRSFLPGSLITTKLQSTFTTYFWWCNRVRCPSLSTVSLAQLACQMYWSGRGTSGRRMLMVDTIWRIHHITPDSSFQKFIYRLNQPFLRIDQSAFTNVSIFDRPIWSPCLVVWSSPMGSLPLTILRTSLSSRRSLWKL